MMSINNNRKWIAVLLAFCMFALAACGGAGAGGSSEQAAKTETETEAEPAAEPSAGSTTEEMVGMINPWTETMDLEEAKKATGIDFEPPVENSLPEGYDLVTYRYMEDLLEAVYQKGDEEIAIRISKERSGIELSGDYNNYSKEWEENYKGLVVTCRGDGTLINCANADLENIHFVVECNAGQEGKGLTTEQLKSIFMGMQAVPLKGE